MGETTMRIRGHSYAATLDPRLQEANPVPRPNAPARLRTVTGALVMP